MQVRQPFCLLHVLNVENLVMEICMVKHKTDSDAMS